MMDSLPAKTGDPQSRLHRMEWPEPARLKRIRALSQLMDQSITLPSGFRIGLDPILGLLPGIGDLLGASLSTWFVYEAARLGIPKRILLRMLGNILLEIFAGAIPILGDVFDAVWKANMRNLRLIELHYHPALQERSARGILMSFGAVFAFMLIAVLAVFFWVIAGLLALLQKLFGA